MPAARRARSNSRSMPSSGTNSACHASPGPSQLSSRISPPLRAARTDATVCSSRSPAPGGDVRTKAVSSSAMLSFRPEPRARPRVAAAVGRAMTIAPPILIAGPTASGKSSLALSLAERYGGVVINANSMQVYRQLRILTARPPPRTKPALRMPCTVMFPPVSRIPWDAGSKMSAQPSPTPENSIFGRLLSAVQGSTSRRCSKDYPPFRQFRRTFVPTGAPKLLRSMPQLFIPCLRSAIPRWRPGFGRTIRSV